MTRDLPAGVAAWLRDFASAVRERDLAAGRALFDAGVVAFGTLCPRANGLDELVAKQWHPVWSETDGFDFDLDGVVAAVDGAHAVVAATWSSRQRDAGGARRGRATLVLRRTGGRWRAVHTHFSLMPEG